MSEEKSLFIGKLQLIKQFRSVAFISEKLDVTIDVVKDWFDGNIDDDLLSVLDELIDKEFQEEIQISIDDDALSTLKENLKKDILFIEKSLDSSETLKVLGGISLATLNRYKKGEIPFSTLLYLRDNVLEILENLSNKTSSHSGINDELNLIKDNIKNKFPSVNLKKSNSNKELEENTDTVLKTKGDVKKVSNNNINITKYLFSGVEKELKEKFGDDIELKKIEFVEDKIVIEAGLKDN